MVQLVMQPCRSVRPPFRRASTRKPLAVKALAADGLTLVATALPLLAAGGVAAWKFANYGQLEYITASMLGNYVPKGEPGPRVIQLQGGTRELYYYPKSTIQVTVVGEGVNKGLMEQAAQQAGVPAVVVSQPPSSNLEFAADGSVDAVVSLGALAAMSDAQRAAFGAEALRVLKPGCPIIFLERIPGGVPLRYIGSPSRTLGESYLEGWKQRTDAFDLVKWDVALEGQDPHAVGVAFKSSAYRVQAVSKRAEKAAEKAERDRVDKEARKEKARLPKKGFEKGATNT